MIRCRDCYHAKEADIATTAVSVIYLTEASPVHVVKCVVVSVPS